jgi:hypothetical protein
MSKPPLIESAPPIKDDDDGNPPWWGPEWDAALNYKDQLEPYNIFKPRDDICELGLRASAMAQIAEWTDQDRAIRGIDLIEYQLKLECAWGKAALEAWHKGDVDFFEQFARYLANLFGERKGKKRQNTEPLAVTIIKIASDLAFAHERHPTKMEVQEAVEKLKDNNGNPLIPNPGKFRWEWSRWHLSFLPGKSATTK